MSTTVLVFGIGIAIAIAMVFAIEKSGFFIWGGSPSTKTRIIFTVLVIACTTILSVITWELVIALKQYYHPNPWMPIILANFFPFTTLIEMANLLYILYESHTEKELRKIKLRTIKNRSEFDL